jgi:hypothetical protein
MSTLAFAAPRSATTPFLPPAGRLRVEPARGTRDGDVVGQQVRLALAAAERPFPSHERRREPRIPYPYPIHLTPLSRGDEPLPDEALVVIGKHLSEHGLDFYYTQPVSHRRVIASLSAGDRTWVGLLLELSWCRFTRDGWYANGGRFLACVPSPLS